MTRLICWLFGHRLHYWIDNENGRLYVCGRCGHQIRARRLT